MSAEVWRKVNALDLSTPREKFAASKGWWWRLWNSVDGVESLYRRFLYMVACRPNKTHVPMTQDVDDFWHFHILDTKKYKADCLSICGRFIDHQPNVPQPLTPAPPPVSSPAVYRPSQPDGSDNTLLNAMLFQNLFAPHPPANCEKSEGPSGNHHDSSHGSHDCGGSGSGSHSSHDSGGGDSGPSCSSGSSCSASCGGGGGD